MELTIMSKIVYTLHMVMTKSITTREFVTKKLQRVLTQIGMFVAYRCSYSWMGCVNHAHMLILYMLSFMRKAAISFHFILFCFFVFAKSLSKDEQTSVWKKLSSCALVTCRVTCPLASK